MTEREQRYLQQRLTYSSFSSSDEETGSSAGSSGSSSSTSNLVINPTSGSDGGTADIPQPFQAMGIDFGLSRVGVAVRQSTHNIPLTTIDRRRDSSSSSSSKGPSRGSSPKERYDREMHLNGQVAHALLTTALEQGCDGFVVGLPVYTLAMQKQELDADLPASSAAAVAALGAAASDRQLRWNGHVRRCGISFFNSSASCFL
jgi:RNase H-fold protein (predicted Holliday junction resolvase)